ncbi:MAG: YceI family protein [Persicimonas sp.]
MPTFDQTNSECVVYVYREGLASAVGHDVAIEATSFEIEVDEDSRVVEARFEADALKVRHAMEDGEPNPGALSDGDKKKIEKNMRRKVLETKRHPVISFRSTAVDDDGSTVRIEGVLDLHGVERDVAFDARRGDDYIRARVRLHQPDFDIEPYRAFLGALRVKAEVDVEVRLPAATLVE